MKRITALLLILAMVLAQGSVAASAAPESGAVKRYTVLVLDTSNEARFIANDVEIYTARTAIDYVKKASSCFLDSIAAAKGENYVAVVSFKGEATVVSDFTKDYDELKRKINNLAAYEDQRNIADGLSKAGALLSAVDNEDTIKNVVLFTTGMTNDGGYNYNGLYDSRTVGSGWYRSDTNIKLYAYANVAIEKAKLLKDRNINIYTIGLFQTMENMPEQGKDIVEFFMLTAGDLATSFDYYHPVDDPEKLEFTFGEVAGEILNPLEKYTFAYESYGKDYTGVCWYTDDYFSKNSEDYNASLATMSLCLAMSAFGSAAGGQYDYTDKSANARDLMNKIGIEDENISVNDWFTQKPSADSIGVIIGSKPLCVNDEEYTLIALAVRGGGYEKEWASNFTIGINGDHRGFSQAKDQVLTHVRNYISEQKITGRVKLWITGYSRAAATANLVGAEIDKGSAYLGDVVYSPYEDVFVYCFECPQCALLENAQPQIRFRNIFNIINFADPVTKVAPSAMGFGRYGVDKYLPSAALKPATYASDKAAMLRAFNRMESVRDQADARYTIDDFKMQKLTVNNWLPGGKKMTVDIEEDTKNNWSQGLYLNRYIDIISKSISDNRSIFVSTYQKGIREVCSILFGCTSRQTEIIIASVCEQASNEWRSLLLSYVFNVGVNPWGQEDDALKMISGWLKNAVDEAGVTDYDEKTLEEAGIRLTDLLLSLTVCHPNYLTTGIMNATSLVDAHRPELCFAWLASMDDNYRDSAKPEFSEGGYRIIRINCEMNVEVVDEYGNTVAYIINEEPVFIEGSAYLYGVDENDQKYIVLPVDMAYRVLVTGRENDLVNYSISEYSALNGSLVRNVNYFDVYVNQGETISGIIPSCGEWDAANGSGAGYRLLDAQGREVPVSWELSGAGASESVYVVSAVTYHPECGIVTGSGIYEYGSYAKVEAFAERGFCFYGWFRDNQLVSTDTAYRFRVSEDTEMVALFKADSCMHEFTEVRNQRNANCEQSGYTGDICCVLCDRVLKKGEKIYGASIGHVWTMATCTSPMSCINCGVTMGEANGHVWMEATYSAPMTCANCGATMGDRLRAPAVYLNEMPYLYKNGKLWTRSSYALNYYTHTNKDAPGCWSDYQTEGHTTETVRDNKGNLYTYGLHIDGSDSRTYYITFDLGKRYTLFTGTVAYPEKPISKYAGSYSKGLQIYADDELIFSSGSLNYKAGPVRFRLDVTGVSVLKIQYPPTDGPNEIATLYDGWLQ